MKFFNPTEEFVDKLIEVIGDRMVFEIGCGKGDLLKALMNKGVPIIGIDPYVDLMDVDLEIRGKILPYEIDRVISMIDEWKGKKKIVLLVARPCHSGFPQEYLSMFGDKCEMIYIGFAKNLETDFEREISLIRFAKFPEHPDCDCVAILKNGHFDESVKMSNQWDKVDKKVRELKGTIDKDLANWFIEKTKNQKSFYELEKEAIIKKFGKTADISSHGGNWKDWKDAIRLSEILKYREVELDISTFMVGGGHFACRIEVKDDELICMDEDEDGKLKTGIPWDHSNDPDRPKYANDLYSSPDITWKGLRDNKRTSNLEAGLEWLKNSFYEFEKKYKKHGIELIPIIENGIIYELEEVGLLERED